MGIVELVLIGIGLSMDAFAVAVCLGLGMKKADFGRAIVVGLYFGLFQAGMPLIGFLVASIFADSIIAFDHWIAFFLLLFLGGKMAVGSFQSQAKGCGDRECPVKPCTDRPCPGQVVQTSLAPRVMLPYAIATSIDALAVGVSFAFLRVNIAFAASIIGLMTLSLSIVGTKLGNIFGSKIRSKAELLGGIILVALGTKILIEHLLF